MPPSISHCAKLGDSFPILATAQRHLYLSDAETLVDRLGDHLGSELHAGAGPHAAGRRFARDASDATVEIAHIGVEAPASQRGEEFHAEDQVEPPVLSVEA